MDGRELYDNYRWTQEPRARAAANGEQTRALLPAEKVDVATRWDTLIEQMRGRNAHPAIVRAVSKDRARAQLGVHQDAQALQALKTAIDELRRQASARFAAEGALRTLARGEAIEQFPAELAR